MLGGLSDPQQGDFLSPRPGLWIPGPEAQYGCLAKSQQPLDPGTRAMASGPCQTGGPMLAPSPEPGPSQPWGGFP